MASQSEIEEILSLVAGRVAKIDGVAAIVLGGSRARGNADERSDIDLGIYYDGANPFSTAALGAAAQELDDRHLDGLVTSFGQWGAAVNGSGWLEIRGHHVDFIYREIGAVHEARGLRRRTSPQRLSAWSSARISYADLRGRSSCMSSAF